MRNICEVIQNVIDCIPEVEEDLRHRFRKLFESCFYTSPEMLQSRWRDGTHILCSSFPEDETKLN